MRRKTQDMVDELRKMNPALLAAKVEYFGQITKVAIEMLVEEFPDQPVTEDFHFGVLLGAVATLQVTSQRGGIDDLMVEQS